MKRGQLKDKKVQKNVKKGQKSTKKGQKRTGKDKLEHPGSKGKHNMKANHESNTSAEG